MRERFLAPILLFLGALRLGAASQVAAADDRSRGAGALRGRPSRGLQQHFFEPFGVDVPQTPEGPDTLAPLTKAPTPTRAPVTKAPTVPKGTKEPKETKAPTTSSPTKAPPPSKAPTYKASKEPCNSNDPGPKGCGDGSGSEEINNYELFRDTTAKTLPVSAFLVTTKSTFEPLSSDFEELAKLVRTVFQEMYSLSFAGQVSYDLVGVYIPRYTVLAPRLVDFEVNVYFRNRAMVPSLFEVESVAKQGLQPGAAFYDLLLGKMRAMQSPFYSQAETVQFISTTQGLNEAMVEVDDGKAYTAGQLALIILLSLLGAALLVFAVVFYLQWRQSQRRTHAYEEYNPIEVKLGKPGDAATLATANSDSVASALRAPGAAAAVGSLRSPRSVSTVEENDEEEDDFMLDENMTFDDVALEDEKAYDAKKCVGEIRKSAFINDRMVPTSPSHSSNEHKQKEDVSQSSKPESAASSNPSEADNGSPRNRNIGEISKAKYRNSVTRSVPVGAAYPGSPKPWNPVAGALQPLPESPETPHSSNAPNGPQRIFQVSTPTKLKPVPSSSRPAPKKTTGSADDDSSVFTIDSQSSATPEFLKKFKEMGLKRPKGGVV